MQEAKQPAPQIDFAQAPIPSTNYSGSYCGLGGPCGLFINSNHCAGRTGRAKYFSGSIQRRLLPGLNHDLPSPYRPLAATCSLTWGCSWPSCAAARTAARDTASRFQLLYDFQARTTFAPSPTATLQSNPRGHRYADHQHCPRQISVLMISFAAGSALLRPEQRLARARWDPGGGAAGAVSCEKDWRLLIRHGRWSLFHVPPYVSMV